MRKVIVTGASGFVGKRLLRIWKQPDQLVPVSIRFGDDSVEKIDWSEVDTVLHLAGLAHQSEKLTEKNYLNANEELTSQLAILAKENGVRSFVFLSTIKVYGNSIREIDKITNVKPDDAYGRSKLQAEQALEKLSDDRFKVAILRAPLIIGPGAKGNLFRLMSLLSKNLPLPFSGINNKRSMLVLDDLIDVLEKLAIKPLAGTYLLSTGTISTTELAFKIRKEMNFRKPKLHSFYGMLNASLKALKPEIYSRLFEDLVVNCEETKSELDIELSTSFDEAISSMVREFMNRA